MTEVNMEKELDDEVLKIEEDARTRFCPVIKENCKGLGCRFYIKIENVGENSYWDCAYIHSYYNLGAITPS